MRYVLGVDGGQTTTTAVVVDETGCLLGIGLGGLSTNLHDSDGAERVQQAVSEAVVGAVRMADLQNARIAAACLSLNGDNMRSKRSARPYFPIQTLFWSRRRVLRFTPSPLAVLV